MTAPSVRITGPGEAWLDELNAFLGPHCFPATHDHLAVRLIQLHAPSHLLWHLSVLPRNRELDSFEDLVSQVRLATSRTSGA